MPKGCNQKCPKVATGNAQRLQREMPKGCNPKCPKVASGNAQRLQPEMPKGCNQKCPKAAIGNAQRLQPEMFKGRNRKCPKAATGNAQRLQPEMPKGCNPKCPKAATRNAQRLQPEMPKGCNQKCPKAATRNAQRLQLEMPTGCNQKCPKAATNAPWDHCVYFVICPLLFRTPEKAGVSAANVPFLGPRVMWEAGCVHLHWVQGRISYMWRNKNKRLGRGLLQTGTNWEGYALQKPRRGRSICSLHRAYALPTFARLVRGAVGGQARHL